MKKIVTCLVTVLLSVALGTSVFAEPEYLGSSEEPSLPGMPEVEETYVQSIDIEGFEDISFWKIEAMDTLSEGTATGVLVGQIAL
ncbi:MAG: hypothetical protein RR841_07515, partial [Eubacterium sp.]